MSRRTFAKRKASESAVWGRWLHMFFPSVLYFSIPLFGCSVPQLSTNLLRKRQVLYAGGQ